MIYLKKETSYFAIDKSKSLIYRVTLDEKGNAIETLKSSAMVDVILKNTNTSITADIFQEQFSKAVEYFHNETPFA